MSKEYKRLKAVETYAQYWYRETANSRVISSTPKRHPYRSIFACDRDRVMYCSAFRRLSSKTQVFNTQTSDNLRTRLTHTLEVAQIARTISCELGLDEELTEAIALGHDVGHTPFGHVGERTLNIFSKGEDKRQTEENKKVLNSHFGFKHNLQSVRVLVEYSEGVKFSNFMLFGVREHSKLWWKKPEDVTFYNDYDAYCSYSDGKKYYPAWSFEAFIVKWADEVAQRHHDIEDAFLQKIIPADDIVEKVEPLVLLSSDPRLTQKYNRLKEETNKLSRKDFASMQYSFAHTLSSFLVDVYVTVLINEFKRVFKHFCNVNNIETQEDFAKKYLNLSVDEIRKQMCIEKSKIYRVDNILGQSLKYSILDSYEVQRMDGKGAYIIRKLVRAYLSNPQQLPSEYINRFIKIELLRFLKANEFDDFMQTINKTFGDEWPENINIWKDYECREVLRVITDNQNLFQAAYAALLRVIFDYIAGMTDSYATMQRIELY